MKRLLFLLVLSAVFLASVSATPLADPCPEGMKLQYYIDNFGSLNDGSGGTKGACSVGSLNFSHFGYGSGSAPEALEILARNIGVTPTLDVVPPAVQLNYGPYVGFLFTAGWSVDGAYYDEETQKTLASWIDSRIYFTVSSTVDPITSMYLDMTGYKQELSGRAQVDETITVSGGLHVVLPGNTEDQLYFLPAVTSLSVTKDILVTTGVDRNGSATMSGVANGFSTNSTPEPGTMALLGAGLLVVVTAARRRLHR